MKETVLVPADRINVVRDQKARKSIEDNLHVKLAIVDNSVEVEGEGVELMQAKTIVKAIGRGFSPVRAERLYQEEMILDIIDLSDFTDKKIDSIKSRIIGSAGKTRKAIEESTDCYVSVYGKTVSVIGTFEQVQLAKHAIEMLIKGAMHVTVYKFLTRIKKG